MGYIFKRNKMKVIRYRRYFKEHDEQNFYREQLMLFLPWRNEDKEINEVNFEMKYLENIKMIRENFMKYNAFASDLDTLNSIQLNEEVLSNQNLELDPEYQAYAMIEVENDLSIDLPELMQNNIQIDKKVFTFLSDYEYTDLIQSLNVGQRQYLSHVMYNIENDILFYEFVSGGAGVGKSTLIKAISQTIARHFRSKTGFDPSRLTSLLIAPTGKAAFNIGGNTMHSAFHLPINQKKSGLIPLSDDALNTLFSNYYYIVAFLMDEISMCGCKLFHHINTRMQQIFQSTEIFGGKSIIMFGDFKQLSPVGDRWIFMPINTDPYSEIFDRILWEQFTYYELTEIMRQKEDVAFAEALNHLGEGNLNNDEIALFKTREKKPNELPDNAIHLFYSNEEANNYNAMIINSKNTYGTKAIAKDKIIGKLKDKDKQNYLNLTKTLKRRETYGLDYVLDLKIDIRYMLTININTHDGLVNGATGILRKIDFDDNNNPKTVYIEFDNSHVGAETRKKNNEQFTPIFLCTKLFQYKNKIDVKISRNQFPLIAAEGITIHKSQGSTYTMIVVHLDRKTKLTRAALYVACSRVTTINGLFFIGIFEPPNSIENAIELNNEISLLRTSKLLIPVFNNMISKSNSLKLLFHNIQSINAHFTDIQSDQNQMNMDLIFLVETWSLFQILKS